MRNRIVERIVDESGVPELLEVLAESLSPTDLQSLLLEVYERRARARTPADLLRRYCEDRFAKPATVSPEAFLEFDRIAFSALPAGFEPIELSPVAPLGGCAVVTGMSQKRVVSTVRGTEVASDPTNGMALECARRRGRLLRETRGSKVRVKLAASQRLVRAQAFDRPSLFAHFRLFALCTAGADEGACRFETEALGEQIDFYLRLLDAVRSADRSIGKLLVSVTPIDDALRESLLEEEVLGALSGAHPRVRFRIDRDREQGRGYYVGVCFHVDAENLDGDSLQLVDGGFTTWTQQLLSNRKERLLVSGIGTERVLSAF